MFILTHQAYNFTPPGDGNQENEIRVWYIGQNINAFVTAKVSNSSRQCGKP